MPSSRLRPGVFLLALVSAGPLFVVSSVGAALYLRLPQPLAVSETEVFSMIGVLLLAVLGGAFLALLPIAVGMLFMTTLARRLPLAAEPEIWCLAGAAAGVGLAFACGAWPQSPEAAFALILTSTVCAAICRAAVELE